MCSCDKLADVTADAARAHEEDEVDPLADGPERVCVVGAVAGHFRLS